MRAADGQGTFLPHMCMCVRVLYTYPYISICKNTCHKLGVIVRELTRVQSSCRMCQYHERGLHANVLSEILALDTNIRFFETQRILVGSKQKKSLEKLVP